METRHAQVVTLAALTGGTPTIPSAPEEHTRLIDRTSGAAALRLAATLTHANGDDVVVRDHRDVHRFDRRGPALRLVGHAIDTEAPAEPVEDRLHRIRERLVSALGPDRFARILGHPVELSASGDVLCITATSRSAAGLIERRAGSELRSAAAGVLGPAATVRIDVREPAVDKVVPSNSPASTTSDVPAAPRAAARPVPTRSVRTYRLDDFVVGESNRLAYNAALQVAESIGASSDGSPRSPLFLHGPCGVGKTHLLQGLAQRFRERNPGAVVRVVSGEAFLNDFVSAIRHGGGAATTGHSRSVAMGGAGGGIERFRRQYRRCDLLCIDDVHLLASKQATQQELLHTFDQIVQSGAQVVLACDRHPRDMRDDAGRGHGGSRVGGFSAALVSRFLSGMVAAIEPPDAHVRERALRQFAQRRGLIIEEPALRLLVDRTAPVPGQSALSVRDLEGMLTRVEAVQRVDVGEGGTNEGPVRIGTLAVRRALGLGDNDVLTSASAAMRRPLRAEQIIAHVCVTLGVERSDLASTTRHKRVVLARAIITHACRELTTMSFPEIARALGRPSHSTVITAQQRLARQIESGEVWGIGAGGEGVTIAALVREVIGGLVK